MIQRTLILLKPDAVQRGLSGRIIERFENAGLKIVGAKMVWVDEKLASEHYNDLGERRGAEVKRRMVEFLTKTGPVMALVLEGVEAIEVVRKLVGGTEPKTALPGTIRGDFAHLSLAYGDSKNKGVANLIHASGSLEEAKKEIELWFKENEIYSYKTAHEEFVA